MNILNNYIEGFVEDVLTFKFYYDRCENFFSEMIHEHNEFKFNQLFNSSFEAKNDRYILNIISIIENKSMFDKLIHIRKVDGLIKVRIYNNNTIIETEIYIDELEFRKTFQDSNELKIINTLEKVYGIFDLRISIYIPLDSVLVKNKVIFKY